MGRRLWAAGEHRHDASGHSPLGLDAKKKTLFATGRSETDRADWRDLIGYLPISKLVFVDECGNNIALTPLYARAPRGKRA